MNDVFSAMDICLDAFHGIVFGRRHLLERGGVDDEINAVHCLDKPISVANVAEKKSHATLWKVLLHFELFELIAGINDELARFIALQNRFDVLLAEGPGTAGN